MLKILRNKQGFSLLFVLAAMLLLLALGVSALTAAGNSHRSVMAQNHRYQLVSHASSMEQVVRGGLENGALAAVILDAVQAAYLSDEDAEVVTLRVSFDALDLHPEIESAYELIIEVRIRPHSDADVHVFRSGGHRVFREVNVLDVYGNVVDVDEIEYGRTPVTVELGGRVVVKQQTDYRNARVTTRVIYHFINGKLVEEPDDVVGYDYVLDMDYFPDGGMVDFSSDLPEWDDLNDMVIIDAGNWMVTGHEVY